MDGLLQKDTKPFSSIEPLRCPVCLKYSFGLKIFICRKGHSVCENCQPDLDECPTCRGRPPQTRNFGLEEMAEGVVAPCPYAEKGCTQSVVGSEYKLHKSICDFG
jgi:E3 ubiquitin-protein ligase SIAH1